MLTEVSRRSHELAAASGNNIELGGSPAAPMTPPQQLTYDIATPSTRESYLTAGRLPGSISELTYRPGAFTRVLSESADAKLTQHTSTGKAGTSSIEDKKSALTSLLNISADNIGTRSISPDITQPPTYVNEVNKLLDLLNHAPAELTPETSRGTTTARSQDASDARKVVSWTEHTDALLRLLNIPFHRRCPR